MCSMLGNDCTIARRVESAVSWKVGMRKRSMLTTSKASGVIWNNIGDSDPFYEIIGIIIVNNLQKRFGGLCAWRLFRIRNYRSKNIIAPSNSFSADLERILYTCLYFATRIILAGVLVFYQPRDKSIIRTPSVCGILKGRSFFLFSTVLPHAAWVALYSTILGFLYIIVTSKLIIYNCLSYVCVIKSFILLSNHSPKSGKTVLPFSSLPLWGANPGSLFFNHSHCSMKDFLTLFKLIFEYFLQ